MSGDTQPDGGVEPAPEPGPDREPLYKFGDSGARLRSVFHTFIIVAGAFLAANVLVLAVVQALVAAGVVAQPQSVGDLPTPVTALVFTLNFVGFFAVGLGYLRWRDESLLGTSLYDLRAPTLRDLGWVAAGILGLLAALAVISAVISQLGLETSENITETLGQGDPQLFLYLIPIAVLLNGPAEEFLFRGIVQGLFRDAYGVVPGVALAGVTFGVVHFLAVSGGNVAVTLTVITVLGLVLGALYEWTDNLAVPAIVHGLFNAVQYTALYASSAGLV